MACMYEKWNNTTLKSCTYLGMIEGLAHLMLAKILPSACRNSRFAPLVQAVC